MSLQSTRKFCYRKIIFRKLPIDLRFIEKNENIFKNCLKNFEIWNDFVVWKENFPHVRNIKSLLLQIFKKIKEIFVKHCPENLQYCLVERKTVREFSVDYEFDIAAVTILQVTEKNEGIFSLIFRKIFKYDTSWPKNDTIRWKIFYTFNKPKQMSKHRSLIFRKIFIYRFSRREILHFCHNSSSCFPRIFLKIFKYGSNWPESVVSVIDLQPTEKIVEIFVKYFPEKLQIWF